VKEVGSRTSLKRRLNFSEVQGVATIVVRNSDSIKKSAVNLKSKRSTKYWLNSVALLTGNLEVSKSYAINFPFIENEIVDGVVDAHLIA
jgi:hypothetical protein